MNSEKCKVLLFNRKFTNDKNSYRNIFLCFVLFFLFLDYSYASLGIMQTSSELVKENIGSRAVYSLVIVVGNIDDADWDEIQKNARLGGYAQYSYLDDKNQSSLKKIFVVGFFTSRASAILTMEKIHKASNRKLTLNIREINKSDKVNFKRWLEKKTSEQKISAQDKELAFLMEQARQAMIKQDYQVAISKYSKIMTYDESDYYRAALEYLGLARERSNQMAHAKAEYERYLNLYPEGEGAERVKQRLDGIMFAAMTPRQKLKKYKPRGFKSDWISVSSMAQHYRTDRDMQTPFGDNQVFSNAYSSFFYMTSLKTTAYEFKNQISMSNNYDLENDDEENSQVKISYLYTESNFKKLGISSRLGRQRYNASGAFGRFDGAVLSYNLSDKLKFSATSGYPVTFDSYQRIQDEKPFYSANLELESLFGLFDINTYFITQYNDTLLDRQAIGFDIRHFDRDKTFFSTIDYDVSYNVLNNFIFNVSTRINSKNSVGTYTTFRRSPLLTTSNSLQGQFVGSLAELLEEKEEETIRQLARDRTAKYGSLTFNWKQHIGKNIELSHDYTLSKLGGTVASDGVFGLDGTGYEDFFSSQLMASDLWTKNDMLLIGLTHAIMDASDRTALTIMRRDQLNSKLLLSTKFRAEYQDRSNGSIVTIIKPAIKINYRYTRKYKFETEIGVDRRIHENSFDEGVYQTLFFNAGYTAQF